MKKRMLMLVVSLFALTPAVLGTAWAGGENRQIQKEATNGFTQGHCDDRDAKYVPGTMNAADILKKALGTGVTTR
jgi:hypothetical protein